MTVNTPFCQTNNLPVGARLCFHGVMQHVMCQIDRASLPSGTKNSGANALISG